MWEEVPKMGPRKFCRVVSLSQRSQGTKRDYSDQLAKESRRQKSRFIKVSPAGVCMGFKADMGELLLEAQE